MTIKKRKNTSSIKCKTDNIRSTKSIRKKPIKSNFDSPNMYDDYSAMPMVNVESDNTYNAYTNEDIESSLIVDDIMQDIDSAMSKLSELYYNDPNNELIAETIGNLAVVLLDIQNL